MAEGSLEFAIRLEALFPRVMRALFNPDPEDPLVELPMAQLRVVRALFRGDKTVSDLSEEFRLSMSACTQMINRLEAMGLVERRGDSEDRRVRHIGLSELGQHRMLTRHHLRVSRAQKVLSGMPEKEQEQIVAALERLLEHSGSRSEGSESLFVTAELELAMPMMPPYTPQDESA